MNLKLEKKFTTVTFCTDYQERRIYTIMERRLEYFSTNLDIRNFTAVEYASLGGAIRADAMTQSCVWPLGDLHVKLQSPPLFKFYGDSDSSKMYVTKV